MFAWHQFVQGFSILELQKPSRSSFAIGSVFEFSSAVTVLNFSGQCKEILNFHIAVKLMLIES